MIVFMSVSGQNIHLVTANQRDHYCKFKSLCLGEGAGADDAWVTGTALVC
jgi:hypothetical protein